MAQIRDDEADPNAGMPLRPAPGGDTPNRRAGQGPQGMLERRRAKAGAQGFRAARAASPGLGDLLRLPARSFAERLAGALNGPYPLYWLSNNLAISRAPRRPEWKEIAAAGITSVVDLRAEVMGDADPSRRYHIEYLRLPIEEQTLPAEAVLERLGTWISDRLGSGRQVLVFCRQGRGRSPLVACAALVSAGWTLLAAYQALNRARPEAPLTRAQQELLEQYAEHMAETPQPLKAAMERLRARRRPSERR
jgi:protein-tyrosine phosphatase